MRPPILHFILYCFLALCCNTAIAGDSTVIRLKTTTPVLTKQIATYYSKGHIKRAKQVNKLLRKANAYFVKELDAKAAFSVAVLDEKDWAAMTYLPYRVYHASDSPFVIFTPALFREPDDTVSTVIVPTVVKLKDYGHSFYDALRIMSDFKTVHELGHLVAEAIPISFFPGKPNKWYNEYMASYLAYAFFEAKKPTEAAVVRIMSGYTDNQDFIPTYKTLDDFEKLYTRVGNKNYGWYQNEFLKSIYVIYEQEGIGLIREIRKAPFNKNQKMSIDDLVMELEKINPAFRTWSEMMK